MAKNIDKYETDKIEKNRKKIPIAHLLVFFLINKMNFSAKLFTGISKKYGWVIAHKIKKIIDIIPT